MKKEYCPEKNVLCESFHLVGEKNGRKIGKMLNTVVKDAEDQKNKLKTTNK